MCACVINHCSRVQLFATWWTVAYQALLSMGFSRQEWHVGFHALFQGNLPGPGIKLGSLMSPAFFFFFFYSVRHFIIYTLQGSLVSAFDILGGWGSNKSNSFYPVEPGSNLNPGLHGSKAHSPFVVLQKLSWVDETCKKESSKALQEVISCLKPYMRKWIIMTGWWNFPIWTLVAHLTCSPWPSICPSPARHFVALWEGKSSNLDGKAWAVARSPSQANSQSSHMGALLTGALHLDFKDLPLLSLNSYQFNLWLYVV